MKNKVTLIAMMLLSVSVLIYGCIGWYNAKESYDDKYMRYLSNKSKLESEKSNLQNETFYVNENGQVDDSIKEDVDFLERLFTSVVTYSSGAEYTEKRSTVKKVITDEAFFDKFMVADEDSTGNSTIDALNLKSIADNVIVTIAGNNQYQIMITYIPYHEKNELDYKKKLVHNQVFVDVEYDGKLVNKATVIKLNQAN